MAAVLGLCVIAPAEADATGFDINPRRRIATEEKRVTRNVMLIERVILYLSLVPPGFSARGGCALDAEPG